VLPFCVGRANLKKKFPDFLFFTKEQMQSPHTSLPTNFAEFECYMQLQTRIETFHLYTASSNDLSYYFKSWITNTPHCIYSGGKFNNNRASPCLSTRMTCAIPISVQSYIFRSKFHSPNDQLQEHQDPYTPGMYILDVSRLELGVACRKLFVALMSCSETCSLFCSPFNL
jgi:hypothetical protein